jgi:FkbM family methyltransferase
MKAEMLQFYVLAAQARYLRRARLARVPLFRPPMMLRTDGGHVSQLYKDVFVQRSYAPPKGLRADARILDAGAHVGLASIFFLESMPLARVVSIEANPYTFACLDENLGRWRRDGRAVTLQRALGRDAGTLAFFVTTSNPVNVNAGLVNRERTASEVTRLEVQGVPISELLSKPFDYAKIDIEGAEYDVLADASVHPGTIRDMVVEFHDVDLHPDRLRALLGVLVGERGYRLESLSFEPIGVEALLATSSGGAVVARLRG